MCDSLAHGGPDDDGIFLDKSGKICLGHRRLAILDLSSAGHQPMSREAEDVWLTFNGEIYNFRELRAELENYGYDFNTGTDTEVILMAYLHWGTDAFGRLEGMFAFALADLRTDKTYLVRGQAGIKPLYYHINDNSLYFASEVKAFNQCGLAIAEDRNWKILFLAFGHIPEPYTTLEGVGMLPKGHYLEWDNQTAAYEIREYFTYQYTGEIRERQAAIDLIRKTLTAAVDRHLIADAPIGTFLSGGIDSSILTMVADQSRTNDLCTLSVNFREAEYNEQQFQHLIASRIAGQHAGFEITKDDFERHFEAILEAMDQPSTDGINSWFISKFAKEHGLKAVLSGIGGDEYFGGYPSFKRAGAIRWLKKVPGFLLRLAEKYAGFRFKRISYLGLKNPIGEYLFLRGCYTPGTISAILGISKEKVLEVLEAFPVSAALSGLKDENRICWFESNLYMQNQLLKDVDAMSMCHGVEIRVPFLDHRMILNTLKIDRAVRFDRKHQKKLLTDAFADLLPQEIRDRGKMGFSLPFQEWMKESGVICNEENYPHMASRKLIRAFNEGKLHWSAAFALYLVHRSSFTPIQKVTKPAVSNHHLRDLLWEPFNLIKTEKLYNYSLN